MIEEVNEEEYASQVRGYQGNGREVNSEANTRRIASVESCFGISGVPLNIPGRVLVGEGVLTKICRKKPKPRQFFLFNDILVYGSIIMNKKKYNTQHIIPLEQVKLEDIQDDGALKNGWLIKTPTKSFAVYAATATEKAEWMAHIKKCVEDLIAKTGKVPTEDTAAVWVPDSDARLCMHCAKTQFTLVNRRHHCRSCGAVVCGNCSKNKFMLPAQSTKPLRVCNTCYDKLSKGRSSLTGDIEINIVPESSEDKHFKDTVNANESSDSDDDNGGVSHDNEGNEILNQDLENLTIDEKPTFYNTSFSIEDSVPERPQRTKEAN